ncbi:Uncharacterized protein PBTT_06910 [Plasmodiophora brassicae]
MFVVSQTLNRSVRRRMADCDQVDARRDGARNGARDETIERLLGYASEPEGSRQDVHSLYHEIMDAWPVDLFSREAADASVRLLWSMYLPQIAAPRPSLASPQPPASPRSDPEQ